MIGATAYRGTLWSKLTLPAGYDKDTFIDALLLEHGEKCVLYSDLEFFEYAVGAWSRKWRHELERILLALTDDYNPLHNFDRHEEYTDKETGKKSGTDGRQSSGDNKSTRSPDLTSENKTSAMNSGTYAPTEQTTTAGTDTTDGEFSQEENGHFDEDHERELKHTAHLYGNIGVTKSQDMAADEVNLRASVGVYDIVCGMFANELLINIY